jgi:uncharacterized membrane protein YkoI
MRANKLILATLAVSTFAMGGAALATQTVPDNRNPVLNSADAALANAKVPIADAIQEAENRTGGDALNALLFSNPGGDPVYLISLQDSTGRGIIDVQVDAKTGQMYGDKGPMDIQNYEPQDSGA